MCTLREFDMRSRGIVNLSEEWKVRHAGVRRAWKLEDVIEMCNTAVRMGRQLYDYFREHGEFPESEPDLREAAYGYFIHILIQLHEALEGVESETATFEDQGYPIKGIDELRAGLDVLEAIISEDALATSAAFNCGALDGE